MTRNDEDKKTPEKCQEEVTALPVFRARHSSSRKLNHWALRNPDDFVRYPRPEPLSYLNETRLLQRAKSGDLEARNAMWLQYARLTFSVANLFRIPEHLLADAIQEGSIALIKAIEKFDTERYNSFSTYAWSWIYNNIQRFIIRNVFPVRPPDYLYAHYAAFRRDLKNAHEPGYNSKVWDVWRQRKIRRFRLIVRFHVAAEQLSLHAIDPEQHPCTYSDFYDDAPPLSVLCNMALEKLDSRERYIISRRYGFNDEPGVTLEELAQALYLTRERIRQIQEVAHKKIREQLRKHSTYILLADEDEQKDLP